MNPKELLEHLADLLDFALRRWLLIVLPFVVCLLGAYYVVRTSPKEFTASSSILLRPAQRQDFGGAAQAPNQALEQLLAIEAWLKSDQVMNELLPLVGEPPLPGNSEELYFALRKLRSSITLRLQGSAVLVVELTGSKAEGLGRRLERILAHLMEGLLRPDNGLLTARQLILVTADDAALEAQKALTAAITAAGLDDPAAVMARLAKLAEKERELMATIGREPGGAERLAWHPDLVALRAAITSNPAHLRRLVALYDAAERTRVALDQAQRIHSSRNVTYPGIFEAPERLTLIGRPRDPLFGQSPIKKYAVLALLLSLIFGGLLAVLAEYFDPRVRSRRQVRAATGLPVVARVSVQEA